MRKPSNFSVRWTNEISIFIASLHFFFNFYSKSISLFSRLNLFTFNLFQEFCWLLRDFFCNLMFGSLTGTGLWLTGTHKYKIQLNKDIFKPFFNLIRKIQCGKFNRMMEHDYSEDSRFDHFSKKFDTSHDKYRSLCWFCKGKINHADNRISDRSYTSQQFWIL